MGFPRNWKNPFLAVFRGMPSAGRSEILETDKELQLGPNPERIYRIIRTNNNGVTGSRMVRGWPETSDSLVTFPHIFAPRSAGSIVISGKKSDDNTAIPATYIGNPA